MNPAKHSIIKQLLDFIRRSNCFEKSFKTIDIISAEDGRCVAELKLEEKHTNSLGTLNAGLSATLVDCVSSYALFSLEDCAVPHVSVSMDMKYLSSAQVGDVILIDANTVKIGKSLAFFEVSIKNKETGILLSLGSKTKYLFRS